MLIDWFTVVAQIVNFLILIALLKRFLYGPIIKAMNERQERIASQLGEAEEKRKGAEKEAASFREKTREIEEKRETLISEAQKDADHKRKQLVQEARRETDDLRDRWLNAVQREKEAFIRDLRQMAGREVYATARRAFKDLADADLETQAVEIFLDRMEHMDQAKREEFADLVRSSDDEMVVRSSFEMPTPMRQKITRKLHQHIADGIDVRYETVPELIMGIELRTSGRKIAWTLEEYLATLEQRAREALENELRRGEEDHTAQQLEEADRGTEPKEHDESGSS